MSATVQRLAGTQPSLDPMIHLVADDMLRVNDAIRNRMTSEIPLIPELAGHLIAGGGKRMRPMLTLASARLVGYSGSRHHGLAAAVEFIHTATLLHDDVVDESSLRRGRQTANAMFGNAASVLVGDFLYSRAFQMMVDAGEMRVMQILADATNVIAEGEVLQLMNMHDPELDEAAYLRVIRAKTAKLFEASSRLAAVLAGADAQTEAHCADYGQALGAAFQIIDDVLDYEGNAAELGKNLGDDLREGKVTLPVICTLQRCSADEAALIREAIENGNTDHLEQIIAIVRRCGGLDDARQAAQVEAQRAIDAARALPSNEWSQAMADLAASLLERRT